MPRETLDLRIKHLFDEILVMDSMVEKITLDAVNALRHRDLESAQRIYGFDQQINAKRFELENECISVIATQQPIMATDLRTLASILEVVSELERMGDYGKGIARICLIHGEEPHVKPLVDIPRMSEVAVGMLHRAVGAFVAGDAEMAARIPQDDDLVDALYNQVYRELVTYMIADPTTIDRANYLMWAAHNLERLADRVTNICERTIYMVTGKLRELSASDDERDALDRS